MTPSPPPGSLTVPPLFGWEHVLTVVVLVALAGVVGLVVLAAGRSAGRRDDWQSLLECRSARRRGTGTADEQPGPPS